ncbi:SusC/RagA family TonB-linked outer membrane protein [Pedobacter sp. UYP1]|uniref:SusC/RagA family TonB-linked outer membrane protein n=1 Tax=Pedobacter sp. UYP1 TaxID=1756396 RepID=UPI00339A7E91
MLCLNFGVNGQKLLTTEITGMVLDINGKPVNGATVSLKTAGLKTTSDKEGTFTFKTHILNDVLKVTYVGYVPVEISIDKNKYLALFKVVLDKSNRELNEVAILSTGYQSIAKERATGSFAQPNSQMFEARVAPNIISKLDGITSGLIFNKNATSSATGSADLSIRGRSTIFANDQPLIVVDNFPFNGDLNTLNPNDVASITILKDAAAASIWGVKAGNGVIVITTKRGKMGQPINISLNSNITISERPNLFYNPNFISSSDYIDIEAFLFKNGRYDVLLGDMTNYPVVSPVIQILNKQKNGLLNSSIAEQQLNSLRANDIRAEELKYFYQKSVAQQYSLSFSGSTDKISYYFSSGFDKTLTSFVNNENDRITLNTQNTFKPFKNLELSAGLYYVKSNINNDNTLTSLNSYNYLPYQRFTDADGIPLILGRTVNDVYKEQALKNGFLDWSYIPLNELGASPATSKITDTRINIGLKYKIITGLSAEVKYQYQQADNVGRFYQSPESYQTRDLINRYSIVNANKVTGYNIPLGGILRHSNTGSESNNMRGQFGYEREWAKSSLSAIAGYEISQFTTQTNSANYYGYNDDLGTSIQVDGTGSFNLNPSGEGSINTYSGITSRLDRIRSSFVNAAYTYDSKYTLSGSARIDGSNYFGVKTNQKNVPLWSVGILWNISRESFYQMGWLQDLKIRLSHGYNGNLDKNNTGITTFKYSPVGATYTNQTYANIINIGNPDLKWEKIEITNLGIDFGLKDRNITGTLEYYRKRGTDLLGDKPFAANTGISTLRGNYSDMKAEGLDFSLTSRNLEGVVGWTTTFLFSATKDKVTRYDVIDPNSVNYTGSYNFNPVVGNPVYGIYSYKWAGLDPINGDPRGYLNMQVSKDYGAIINNTTPDELEYSGPARPTVFGGLNNLVSFKKLTLSFNISYKLGYYFRKPSVNYYGMYQLGINQNMNNDFDRRWQKAGDESITNVPSMAAYTDSGYRDQFYNGSSATVQRGDHIRLQDISLSFDLDRTVWNKLPVKQLRLYIYANNLWIIWKANHVGLDPDAIPYNGDSQLFPSIRTISFGLKTNF